MAKFFRVLNNTLMRGTFFYILISIFIFQACNNFEKPIEITQLRFEREMIKSDDVNNVVIVSNLNIVEVYIKSDRLNKPIYNMLPKKGPHFYFAFDSQENLQRILRFQNDFNDKSKISIDYELRIDIGSLFLKIFIAIYVILWIFLLIDILKSNFENSIDKLIWFVVISFIPVLGCILYLFIGRKQKIKKGHNNQQLKLQ